MNLTTKQFDDKKREQDENKEILFFLLCGMLTPMLANAQDYIETERK